MKKELTDKAIDDLMRTLLDDAAQDERVLNEIADSPSIWWGVQRKIAQQGSPYRSPWPPTKSFWKMLLIGFPVTAAATLLIVFFFSAKPTEVADQAGIIRSERNITVETQTGSNLLTTNVNNETSTISPSGIGQFTPAKVAKTRTPSTNRSNGIRKVDRPANLTVDRSVKTDFIALSYAGSPESGQIVKVKVPSSMMVTLGLVSSVERPSSLVDAEVLVGDDGLTHSIRFIRKSL